MINVQNRLNELSRDESGFTTAELLGNAALGIAALVVIWGLLGGVAKEVVANITQQLTNK